MLCISWVPPPAPPPLLAGGACHFMGYVVQGVIFPAEKLVSLKAMLGQVALRLGVLGKGPALEPLAVTAQDNGGADALDEPLVFAVLADGVEVDRFSLVIYHVHGSDLL